MADSPGAPSAAPSPTPTLDVRPDGIVVYNGLAVGTARDGALTVNLGWCRLAGLSVHVQGDPDVDRTRSGYVLDRPVPR